MKTSRFTIDLDPAFDRTLASLAEEKGTSKAEIIKRALATYSYIAKEASTGSQKKLSITGQDDRIIKDIVIP